MVVEMVAEADTAGVVEDGVLRVTVLVVRADSDGVIIASDIDSVVLRVCFDPVDSDAGIEVI